MTATTTRTIKETNSLSMTQKIAETNCSEVVYCPDIYGNFIWALAKKFTSSAEEEEAAAKEIFIDIWRYAERADKLQSAEKLLISLIARKRLVKYLNTSDKIY